MKFYVKMKKIKESARERELERHYVDGMIIRLILHHKGSYLFYVWWKNGNFKEKGKWLRQWPWSQKEYYSLSPTEVSNIEDTIGSSESKSVWRRIGKLRGTEKLIAIEQK